METHKGAVARLAEDVARFYTRTPFWIYHGSTNCTRQISFDRSGIIDTSDLNHVLEIDPKSMVVIAEPNVPMDLLIQTTLKHGFIPPVVPEFPGITVGGAFSGTAGESSSFKYGYFDRTVNSIEIILANGEVTRASQIDEKKDLFNGAAGAFGTLGVLTLLEIQLIPAKIHVALTYIPVGDTKDAIATLKECVVAEKQPFDFVDGIQFSKDLGVVCVGHMTDTCTNTPQTFSGPWDPWFYMHAQSRCSSGSKKNPSYRHDTFARLPLLLRPWCFLDGQILSPVSLLVLEQYLLALVLGFVLAYSSAFPKYAHQQSLPEIHYPGFGIARAKSGGVFGLCERGVGDLSFVALSVENWKRREFSTGWERRTWGGDGACNSLEYGAQARRTSGSLSLRTGGWSGGWVSLAGENGCMLILIIRETSFGSCMTGNSMMDLGGSIVQRVYRMCTIR